MQNGLCGPVDAFRSSNGLKELILCTDIRGVPPDDVPGGSASFPIPEAGSFSC